MPELIDRHALLKKVYEHQQERERMTDGEWCRKCIYEAPTIEPKLRHGRWIECDYKHIEHGMIETEPKAGLCCSECRIGFKKNRMTYKAFCPACGARMDADHIADASKKVGGADNG